MYQSLVETQEIIPCDAGIEASIAEIQCCADPTTSLLKEVPLGDAGIAASIAEIQRFADQASLDPRIIYLARRIVASVPDRDKAGQADALFWFVKDHIRFINDPLPAEMIQSPIVTLREGWGDCDDMVTLLAALNQSIGNQVAFVTVSYPGMMDFIHIFLVVADQYGNMRAYDPALPQSYPGWCLTNVGRVRVWYSAKDYKDLAGFFSSIGNFFKKVFKAVAKVVKKVFKEIERAVRRVKREINRTFKRIAKEFARWEKKLGIVGKFLVLGIKVLVTATLGAVILGTGAFTLPALVMGQGVMLTIGEAVNSVNPFVCTIEEVKFLANLALSIGSTILSLVSGGAAAPLLASSIMNLMSAGISALDLMEKKKQAEELKAKIKEQIAKVSLEARIQREAIAKLEKDILLIEETLTAQKEAEMRMVTLKSEHESQVGLIWDEVKQGFAGICEDANAQLAEYAKTLTENIKDTVRSELEPYWSILTMRERSQIAGLINGVVL